ncbi:MAG TPA: alanine racemase [Gemmatimonadaceae bacterium]
MRHDQRRAWVEVDLGALKRNASMLAQRARVPLLPMVKSDAYGLGVEAVVWALEPEDPWGYGVATVAEGAQLRSIGVSRPVLVFTPLLAEEFDECRVHQLTPTLGDAMRIKAWHSSGGETWHLGIDTGMNRAGIPWQRVKELATLVEASPPEGAFTHFHSADVNDGSRAEQEDRFTQAVAQLPRRPKYLHAENSPALERKSPSKWNLARPGVALYGVGGGVGSEVAPETVASLNARIVEIRDVEDGGTVSYGATWRADGWRRIATVSAGYADGIRRSLSNRGSALVSGKKVPIAGIVTMDMTMLDVTGIDCSIGDVATFLGRQQGEELRISDVAASGELSPYEVLVGLGLRAPRIYLDGDA